MALSRNPLDDLRETIGHLTDQLKLPGSERVDDLMGDLMGAKPGPARPLAELQAELDASSFSNRTGLPLSHKRIEGFPLNIDLIVSVLADSNLLITETLRGVVGWVVSGNI